MITLITLITLVIPITSITLIIIITLITHARAWFVQILKFILKSTHNTGRLLHEMGSFEQVFHTLTCARS